MPRPPRLLLGLVIVAVLQAALGASECGARELLGKGAPAIDLGGAIEGLECPGFAEDRRCCDALPAQKVLAFLQYAVQHDRDTLAAFEPTIAETERALAAGAADECSPVFEMLIRPRLSVLPSMIQRSLGALNSVEHLVMSGLCAYCFAEEEGSTFRVTQNDGPAARQLSGLALSVHATQQRLQDTDAEMLALEEGKVCVPKYLAELWTGSVAGSRVASTQEGLESADGSANAEAFMGSVEAIARLRRWPHERRRLSSSFHAEALEHFDDDFFEIAERLLSFLVGPVARIVHQLQLLTLTFGGRYHRSSSRPVARLLWGAGAGAARTLEHSAGEAAIEASRAPLSSASSVRDVGDDGDHGSRFGMVVLISNRTEEGVVQGLLQRLEGPRTLFLEDVCGDAFESLGAGCHGGGLQQSRCLTPVYAAAIAQGATADGQPVERLPRAAWRRHGTTRSIAHSASVLAASYWGEDCVAWLADFRPSSACPGAPTLAEAFAAGIPGAKLELVREPAKLLGLPTSAEGIRAEPPDAAHLAAQASDMLADTPLATRLAEYLEFHRRGVAALASDADSDIPVLVYSCQPYAQCGGHGDRLNGIVTAFMLAVLTRRLFLIDSESPLPLQLLLTPRLVDWRVRGGLFATAFLRHHSYHDKRRQFDTDLGRLASYPERVLVLTLNYRMLRMLFEAPALHLQAAELGLPLRAPPFLVAEIFDVLFAPSPALRQELAALRHSVGNPEDGRFIAVHLRTGDVAWDPARHGKTELSSFLACALKAEQELGLPADTPWLLATDSAEVAQVAASSAEAASGKLRVPGGLGRIHIDRSDMGDVLEGVSANYAEWLLFGHAAAVVLSRSFFGETAAEVGRVPFAYFAPGGGCVRTELSSS